MTLTDAQIDRWSRQILVPEVGGRGQQRLLAARVTLAGRAAHPMREPVADLLERAGVRTSAEPVPARPDLVIDFDGGDPATDATGVPRIRASCRGATATVLTLLGQPCAACAPAEILSGDAGDPLAAAAAAGGAALVAAEALRVLLDRPATGRRQRIDLRHGIFAGEPVEAPGCGLCRKADR